jgi:hypothetical protein
MVITETAQEGTWNEPAEVCFQGSVSKFGELWKSTKISEKQKVIRQRFERGTSWI